ncbi:MAG: zinc ABC transporter substrate-binding protein [Candidatus Lindowbacteria bacterium]|nr:zinc ABC transporter substrate-binding protein [Candidatus Lindowbacteria bacterium]
MRKRILMALSVAFAALLSFYSPPGAEGAGKLNVLATHTVMKSITERIGRDHVSVSCLSTGKEDPHAISAKPSYMVSARKADLFIKMGMELEIGYEQLVVDGSRNYKIRYGQPGYLDVSLNVLRREVPTTRVDRSLGDVHPLGNPHYWMDPYNARIMAQTIASKLTELDPQNTAYYSANSADFIRRVDEAMFGKPLVDQVGGDKLWSLDLAGKLDSYLTEKALNGDISGWYAQTRPLRGTKVITYHRSWIYFTDRFGLKILSELEPKPGIPPSPSHLLGVVQTASQQKAKVILMEPFYDPKAAEFVAAKTGAKVVEIANAVNGQPGVTDYLSLIDNAVRRVKEAA